MMGQVMSPRRETAYDKAHFFLEQQVVRTECYGNGEGIRLVRVVATVLQGAEVVEEQGEEDRGRRQLPLLLPSEPEEQEKLEEKYVYWGELRPTVFELIKGKRTPVNMNTVLILANDECTVLLG